MITPLNDRVIVSVIEQAEITKNGLFIPENAKEKPQEGLVIAAGPGVRSAVTGEFVPLNIQQGDKILFGKYSGTEVTVDDVKFLILREDEIFAKLD